MAEVFYRAVREGTEGAYSLRQREVWAPRREPTWDRPDKLLDQWAFVAEDESGGLLGFMSMDHDGYLDMAFVIPEAMGSQVAPALYTALLARTREAGLSRLTVRASILARRFFLKQGWQVDAQSMHAADGEIYETYLMSLDLSRAPE